MPAFVMSLCVAENADGNWDTVYTTKWDQLWSLTPGPLQDISVGLAIGSKQKIPSHPWQRSIPVFLHKSSPLAILSASVVRSLMDAPSTSW